MFRVESGYFQPVLGFRCGGGQAVTLTAPPPREEDSDEFRMFEFKVRKCPVSRAHDWTVCPWAHPGERARRRDPRRVPYKAVPCEEYRASQACRRGDRCEYAHGVFEYWLHPSRYRTRACVSGGACSRKVCFFAHQPAELRPGARYQTRDRPSGFRILSTASRGCYRVECEVEVEDDQCDDEMPHVEWIKDLVGS